ncbi:MAG: citrate synthase [Opitutales bacterium]
MEESATIRIRSEKYTFPLIEGTEKETAVDLRTLRGSSGCITFDDGYGNTGSCESKITFIDGEKGILRYRGYPIEQLAEHSNFLESAYLLLFGELPNSDQLSSFQDKVANNAGLRESMTKAFDSFAPDAHPMAVLSAMVNNLGTYHPEMSTNNRKKDLAVFDDTSALLISAIRTIAARDYRSRKGLAPIHPDSSKGYCSDFLQMTFSDPSNPQPPPQKVCDALNLVFLLHADHEQNCSTSTCRMVASGGANPFASVSAAIGALWGPLHGGANMAVIKMLNEIHESGDDGSRFIEDARSGKTRLMGFGHRVYKNYDPRAKILNVACNNALEELGVSSPTLDIARHLEEVALNDDYFIERKLYPNVDFYSGILLEAIGFPLNMFTVIFAIGRLPGWLSHWKEIAESGSKIHRPRQVYQGATIRDYVPLEER